ncbi:MAG: hypothetical protein HWN79_01620 [Candidatus Lokiarchaeota archaeon]|nr:hypothetical protein [Candidatus Lokiarchaeota archaeon]
MNINYLEGIFLEDENIVHMCPRCGEKNIIIYEESIECTVCQLEFEKKDIKVLEKSLILGISEKLEFIRSILGENKNG